MSDIIPNFLNLTPVKASGRSEGKNWAWKESDFQYAERLMKEHPHLRALQDEGLGSGMRYLYRLGVQVALKQLEEFKSTTGKSLSRYGQFYKNDYVRYDDREFLVADILQTRYGVFAVLQNHHYPNGVVASIEDLEPIDTPTV